ncbi:MAG: hypothetical protein LWX01_03750 [Deltaproteobacteria bacterium]|nr:hypothetical protein [Deltaproteobacteria bacterium]MDL1960802.1 hypothetical protein [Deltaproteobacteria bacterium]
MITRFIRGVKGIDQVKPGLKSIKFANNQKELADKYTFRNMPEFSSASLRKWSIGMMGLEDFLTIKMAFSSFTPIFQHSIPPCVWHKQVAIKRPIISISCRISETLNYNALDLGSSCPYCFLLNLI